MGCGGRRRIPCDSFHSIPWFPQNDRPGTFGRTCPPDRRNLGAVSSTRAFLKLRTPSRIPDLPAKPNPLFQVKPDLPSGSGEVVLTVHTGSGILPFLADAARLRISVFREWPYLYEGDADSEEEYLKTYLRDPRSMMITAQAGGRVVGASTGMPLEAETPELIAPFTAAALNPAEVFYYGESVLLPEFRGRGIGVDFFSLRESYARSLPGMRFVSFCAVQRPQDHPLRPESYLPLDLFWEKRGFRKTAMETRFSWKDRGESEPSPKPMRFWIKDLE